MWWRSLQKYQSINATVCCTEADTGYVIGGNPIADKWLYRFQHSGVPPTGKGMPMCRLAGL